MLALIEFDFPERPGFVEAEKEEYNFLISELSQSGHFGASVPLKRSSK